MKILVLGQGKSANHFIGVKPEYDLVIGVNDHDRYFGFAPDILVVLDPLARASSEEKANAIMNTKASEVWTQLESNKVPLATAKRVKISASRSSDFRLIDQFNYVCSVTSVHVALQIAYWKGATQIDLFGVDLDGHVLNIAKKRIKQDLQIAAAAIRKQNVIVNLNCGIFDYELPKITPKQNVKKRRAKSSKN